MEERGLITLVSPHSVAVTMSRLKAALNAKAVTIYACVDYAAGASHYGMPLKPARLLLFGSPETFTPLLQDTRTVGLDLPLKALVWEDEQGAVRVSYNDPAWIAGRHGLSNRTRMAVEGVSRALKALTGEALKPQ